MTFLRLLFVALGLVLPIVESTAQPSPDKRKTEVEPARGAALHAAPYVEFGPLIGSVTSTNAKIWVKLSGPAPLSLVVGKEDDLSDGVAVKAPKLEVTAFYSTHIVVPDLEPAARYYYAIVVDGQMATPRPFPSFKTAPSDNASGRQRFAFVSCVGYNGFDSAATWADMATRTNFDVLLMLGDNHYGNTTVPARHFEMYGVQRRLPGYAEISRRIPQYAVW
ncbi:MAG TPA: hypothetical protein VNT99_04860, partial [Methylomirabilota bacterium]|nr:hypothetical protein [Methylomirabilota bacterium]